MPRLFIAVEAPVAVREAAEAAIAELRPCGDVRWTPVENLHLTLKFLGETAEDRIPTIQKNLAEIANDFSVFVIRLGRPGAFPNARRPQVLWLGLEGGIPPEGRLADLAKALDSRMVFLGFPPETRPYRAHLTLGRVRSQRGISALAKRLAELHSGMAVTEVLWPIREICLVESHLQPGGSRYETLGRWKLNTDRTEEE